LLGFNGSAASSSVGNTTPRTSSVSYSSLASLSSSGDFEIGSSQLARMADNSPNACDYLARGMLPNSRIGPARAINDYGRTNGIAGRKGKHSGLKACTASSLVLGSPGDVYDSLHTCHRNRVSHHASPAREGFLRANDHLCLLIDRTCTGR